MRKIVYLIGHSHIHQYGLNIGFCNVRNETIKM